MELVYQPNFSNINIRNYCRSFRQLTQDKITCKILVDISNGSAIGVAQYVNFTRIISEISHWCINIMCS